MRRLAIVVVVGLGCGAGCRTQPFVAASRADMAPLESADLVVDDTRPIALASDDTELYWPTSDGSIFRVAKSGGVPLALAVGEDAPSAIAADHDAVYWTTRHTIRRWTKQSGDTTTLLDTAALSPVIAVDDANVYCATTDLGAVLQIPKNGGRAISIVRDQQFGLGILGLAVDHDTVYFTNHHDGTVVAAAFGEQPTIVATHQPAPYGIVAADGVVYWTRNNSPGTVMRADANGGAAALVGGLDLPWTITSDASAIYWLDDGDGSVWRAGRDGTSATMMARTGGYPQGIVVDSQRVYWADRRLGKIFSTAK